MQTTVDYYLAPVSPWTYLGHARFVRLCEAAGATVRLHPIDLGRVFPVSGGLPLGQRAPQRQAYRLVELARFRDATGLPMNVQPQYFPAAGDGAARLIVAVDQADGVAAALKLTGRMLAAVWAEQRNIADPATLAQLLAECGLPAARMADARNAAVQTAYEQHTQQAIAAGVFGAPSYVIEGEMFWGQDRLDFVQQRLARG